MRAELAVIAKALEVVPVDEPLIILTDSLSAIDLLCRLRQKRVGTPYGSIARCADIMQSILERL